jgi:tetratricopeptide (TPR) repeat protein
MAQAAALTPQDARLWLALCSSLKTVARLSEAMAACRRSVEADPDSFGAHFELATLLDEAGQKEEALRELERARRAPGLAGLDLADYHYGMGAVLYSMPGREREAIPHFQEALRLNPDARQAVEVRAALSALGASP